MTFTFYQDFSFPLSKFLLSLSAPTKLPMSASASPSKRRSIRMPRSDLPTAGRLSHCLQAWVCVTSNTFVLSIIRSGLMLHFHTTPPFLHLPSAPSSLSRHRSISSGISKLLNKKAIKQVTPCLNQFVSPIFIVPKKDSLEGRIIINLKLLNTYIFRTKFKIEGYEVIVNMISQYDFMCSIDLQDAFLAVSMHPNFFLLFMF